MLSLYMHAGSMNHGCEAIVKSTISMTQQSDIVLYSKEISEDITMGLDKICCIKTNGGKKSKTNLCFIFYKLLELLLSSKPKFNYLYRNILKEAKASNLYLSIGGDNYCYSQPQNKILAFLNSELNKRGCKTALWGCSIEPNLLKDLNVLKDLQKYKFISARESITYEALKKANANSNIYLYPDPAFTLPLESIALPTCFNDNNVVGINISPLICKEAKSETLAYDNYNELIYWILKNTDMTIVLIPHVCKSGNDDRLSAKRILSEFNCSRVILIDELNQWNCSQIKFAISKCRFIVTARTHASIAAYSTLVPTLVVGYSVKANGIAKDIFGDFENFVINIQKIENSSELKKAFVWLYENETPIRNKLKAVMPGYIQKAKEASWLIK